MPFQQNLLPVLNLCLITPITSPIPGNTPLLRSSSCPTELVRCFGIDYRFRERIDIHQKRIVTGSRFFAKVSIEN
jgi:hypothetical protein